MTNTHPADVLAELAKLDALDAAVLDANAAEPYSHTAYLAAQYAHLAALESLMGVDAADDFLCWGERGESHGYMLGQWMSERMYDAQYAAELEALEAAEDAAIIAADDTRTVAIVTKYVSATDHSGSRIRATADTGHSLTVPFNYEAECPFEDAALSLALGFTNFDGAPLRCTGSNSVGSRWTFVATLAGAR